MILIVNSMIVDHLSSSRPSLGARKWARITVSKEKIEGTRQTYLITRTVALSHSQFNHSSQNAFVTEQRSTLNCVEPKVGRW